MNISLNSRSIHIRMLQILMADIGLNILPLHTITDRLLIHPVMILAHQIQDLHLISGAVMAEEVEHQEIGKIVFIEVFIGLIKRPRMYIQGLRFRFNFK